MLALSAVSAGYGCVPAISDVSIAVGEGEKSRRGPSRFYPCDPFGRAAGLDEPTRLGERRQWPIPFYSGGGGGPAEAQSAERCCNLAQVRRRAAVITTMARQPKAFRAKMAATTTSRDTTNA